MSLTSGNDYKGPLYAPHPDITMTEPKPYGTPEFYEELFADIMADVGTGLPERDEEVAEAMMAGFEKALIGWLNYHETCIKSYKELHARFLGISRID
tara:strand:- start:1237 stop:1527 length:291 start_codon:yes stop_codon:yes gene_type:complete